MDGLGVAFIAKLATTRPAAAAAAYGVLYVHLLWLCVDTTSAREDIGAATAAVSQYAGHALGTAVVVATESCGHSSLKVASSEPGITGMARIEFWSTPTQLLFGYEGWMQLQGFAASVWLSSATPRALNQNNYGREQTGTVVAHTC